MKPSIFRSLLVLASSFAHGVRGQDVDYTSSPNPGGGVEVFYHVLFMKLEKLDAVDSQFYTDIYLSLAWRDDRIDPTNVTYDPSTMWGVSPEFMNRKDVYTAEVQWTYYQSFPGWLSEQPGLDKGGNWVWCQSRVLGYFAAEMSLKEFPMDYQTANVKFESFIWNGTFLQFTPVHNLQSVMLDDGFNVVGWDVVEAKTLTTHQYYPAWGESYDRAILSVKLQRLPGFYYVRVVVSIVLLVCLGLLTSAMRVTEAERMTVLLHVFVGLVTWMFVLTELIPKSGELTRLDSFMNISFAVVFLLALLFAGSKVYRELTHRAAAIKAMNLNHTPSSLHLTAGSGGGNPRAINDQSRQREQMRCGESDDDDEDANTKSQSAPGNDHLAVRDYSDRNADHNHNQQQGHGPNHGSGMPHVLSLQRHALSAMLDKNSGSFIVGHGGATQWLASAHGALSGKQQNPGQHPAASLAAQRPSNDNGGYGYKPAPTKAGPGGYTASTSSPDRQPRSRSQPPTATATPPTSSAAKPTTTARQTLAWRSNVNITATNIDIDADESATGVIAEEGVASSASSILVGDDEGPVQVVGSGWSPTADGGAGAVPRAASAADNGVMVDSSAISVPPSGGVLSPVSATAAPLVDDARSSESGGDADDADGRPNNRSRNINGDRRDSAVAPIDAIQTVRQAEAAIGGNDQKKKSRRASVVARFFGVHHLHVSFTRQLDLFATAALGVGWAVLSTWIFLSPVEQDQPRY